MDVGSILMGVLGGLGVLVGVAAVLALAHWVVLWLRRGR